MNRTCLAICMLLVTACLGGAEDQSGLYVYGSPIEKLPPQVEAAEGELTLYADFANRKDDGVPLYVVNRTNEARTFDSEGQQMFIMLEYRSDDGTWKRAQQHLGYSWCGTSRIPMPVAKPNTFFSQPGYSPAEGKKVKVRYAFHDGKTHCVSNAGEGFVSEREVAKAAYDEMAIRFGKLDLVMQVARGQVPLVTLDLTRLRPYAIRQIRHRAANKEEAVEALKSIAAEASRYGELARDELAEIEFGASEK